MIGPFCTSYLIWGQYKYDVHENSDIFKSAHPSNYAHKVFHSLDPNVQFQTNPPPPSPPPLQMIAN